MDLTLSTTRCRRDTLIKSFKKPPLLILPHFFRREIFAIHGYIYALRQGLHERKGTAQVEEPVGAAEFIGDHGAGEYDGLALNLTREVTRCFRHGIGAMCYDDATFFGGQSFFQNFPAVFTGHFQAVHHEQRFDLYIHRTSAKSKHFRQVRILKKELAVQLIVFLIEGAARYNDLYTHGWLLADRRLVAYDETDHILQRQAGPLRRIIDLVPRYICREAFFFKPFLHTF